MQRDRNVYSLRGEQKQSKVESKREKKSVNIVAKQLSDVQSEASGPHTAGTAGSCTA